MHVMIRSYRKEDRDAIIKLFILNTPQFFCPPEQADLEEYLEKEIEHYYVVEQEGQILACGGSNVKDSVGCLSWYIVHPDEQGKGLGRMLADKNLQILKADERVSKIIVRTSQLAYRFYEKAGFVLISTEDNYWGEGMHLYKMELKS
jgi:ribosomal-protein-alanine N-acetyltransferase